MAAIYIARERHNSAFYCAGKAEGLSAAIMSLASPIWPAPLARFYLLFRSRAAIIRRIRSKISWWS
jgi:hypothetical protein